MQDFFHQQYHKCWYFPTRMSEYDGLHMLETDENRHPIFTNPRIETKQINTTWRSHFYTAMIKNSDIRYPKLLEIQVSSRHISIESAMNGRVQYHNTMIWTTCVFPSISIKLVPSSSFISKNNTTNKNTHTGCGQIVVNCVPALSTEAIKHAPRSPMSFWERSLQDIFVCGDDG